MCGTIFNYRTSLLGLIFLFLELLSSFGQEGKSRSIKLVVGSGYGHYFNNFSNVSDQDVANNRLQFSGKLLWKPEYRLGIGIESGFYSLYSTTRIQTDNGSTKLTSNLKVVPIFLSVSMGITKHIDLNVATGWSSLFYLITINKSKSNRVVGQTFSMSNYAVGGTYHVSISPRIEAGMEMKYLYLGKTNDHHISASFVLSYRLINHEVTSGSPSGQ